VSDYDENSAYRWNMISCAPAVIMWLLAFNACLVFG